MHSKLSFTRKVKFITWDLVCELYTDFINDSYAGRRTRKDGKPIHPDTVINYIRLKKLLDEYHESRGIQLKIYLENHLTYQEKTVALHYYRKFYSSFTNYLYTDRGHFDNYVGLIIKQLRCFFNYLENERRIVVGTYHMSFYVPKEDIPIIALSIEQLKYVIFDHQFIEQVRIKKLDEIRDIFVFGCTVALRVSDLLNLTTKNLIYTNNHYYLRVKSQKTSTYTTIKLPDYAVELIHKYQGKYDTLLPAISAQWFNSRLKQLARLLPDDFEIIKVRERRGKQVVIYKNEERKEHFTLSDHLTTHTMRRTAITTMLNLGMPEHIVRKISGHAANSREFYRYVQLSQHIIDQESDKVFEKLHE